MVPVPSRKQWSIPCLCPSNRSHQLAKFCPALLVMSVSSSQHSCIQCFLFTKNPNSCPYADDCCPNLECCSRCSVMKIKRFPVSDFSKDRLDGFYIALKQFLPFWYLCNLKMLLSVWNPPAAFNYTDKSLAELPVCHPSVIACKLHLSGRVVQFQFAIANIKCDNAAFKWHQLIQFSNLCKEDQHLCKQTRNVAMMPVSSSISMQVVRVRFRQDL